jgi:integrase
MPRPNRVPSYRLHKQSRQAVVTLPDGDGGRHDVLLGPFGSAESRAEYARVIAEWEANGQRLPQRSAVTDLTVYELGAAFMRHADQHYRRADGTATHEVDEYKLTLRPLCHLYGHTPARDFGPLALKAVRDLMVKGYDHPRYRTQPPLCRSLVNQRIGRVRRMFKWAVEQEVVPPAVMLGLQAVRGLQRGRSAARETEPVRPVADHVVALTLPYLLPEPRAMVELQLLAGMRPGEVVVMRACDIDMVGKVWLYRPGRHKTEHHGHGRVIALGPKAQEVLKPFLTLDTQAYLFSPRSAIAALRAELRRNRRTKVQPSQQDRRKRKPKRQPGERYTVGSYGAAIARACDQAFPPPAPLCHYQDETKAEWQARLTPEQHEELKAWRLAHRWHPHRLRHTAATKLRREFGLDVARVVLGHRSPQITELYAELDIGRAAEVMERLG